VVIGEGRHLINPLHGADLAEVVVHGIDDASRHNLAMDVGGPDIYTYRELGLLAGEVFGRRVRTISIPLSLIRLAGAAAGPFSANAAALLKMAELLGETDVVGTPVGDHHLRDFFRDLAE
jgi:uncharacterized protein YbjT (DUF2867 family)